MLFTVFFGVASRRVPIDSELSFWLYYDGSIFGKEIEDLMKSFFLDRRRAYGMLGLLMDNIIKFADQKNL